MVEVALFKTLGYVPDAGESIVVMYGPVVGGLITNPGTAIDQGIDVVEPLFIDIVGPASLVETATTIILYPGQTYAVPPGLTSNVSVNAATAGHKFSGIIYQLPTPYPPTPQIGAFPPAGPVTLTETIPAYVYEEYADDDDIQAFFASYNALVQSYVDWFATISLPVYTGAQIAGALLDWIAEGIYGIVRPSLSSGRNRDLGPLNTYTANVLPFNTRRRVGPADVAATDDDIFKRIITWNFYKGDGHAFNVRWLKRRIMRFLIGTDGTAPNIEQTYAISVTFGAGHVISIRISQGERVITGGSLYNRMQFNQFPYNGLVTELHSGPAPLPFVSVLQEAIRSGVLQLPFQYSFVVVA